MTGVAIVDYGVGNVGSLRPLFADLGLAVRRSSTPEDVRDAALVVLPGVGSAVRAMGTLENGPVRHALLARHQAGRAIVGICLGAQVLHDHLEESGAPGLGLLAGKVERRHGERDVNVGWRPLDHEGLAAAGLADGIASTDTVFFNHGFCLPVDTPHDVVWTVGADAVPAIVLSHGLVGLQFHPEKSQDVGRRLMSNVVELLGVR